LGSRGKERDREKTKGKIKIQWIKQMKSKTDVKKVIGARNVADKKKGMKVQINEQRNEKIQAYKSHRCSTPRKVKNKCKSDR